MKKYTIIFILSLTVLLFQACPIQTPAQDPGIFGPENIANSGANIVNLEDPVSTYYNPASLSTFKYPMFAIETKNEFTLSSLGLSIPIPRTYSCIGLCGFKLAEDLFINSLSYSSKLMSHTTFGISTNVISYKQSKIFDHYELSVGAGLLYTYKSYKPVYVDKFGLGFNAMNINGVEIHNVELPSIYDLGMFYHFHTVRFKLYLKAKYVEDDKFYYFIGTEKCSKKISGLNILVGAGDEILSCGLSYYFKDYNVSLGAIQVDDEWHLRTGVRIRYGASDEVFAREHLELGRVYLEEGNYKDALKEFDLVLSKIPSYYDALEFSRIVKERLKHENKLKIYKFVLEGQEAFNKGDFDNAISNWKNALKLMPQPDKNLLVKIESAKKLSEIKEKKKKTQPKDTDKQKDTEKQKLKNIYNTAIENYNRNNLYQALSLLKQIYNIDPEYKDTAGRIEDIETEIDQMLENYINEGDNLFSQKKFSQAAERYSMAYYLNKNNSSLKNKLIDCHLKAGEFFYRNDRYKEAIREWEKILKFDPDNKIAKDYIETARKKLNR